MRLLHEGSLGRGIVVPCKSQNLLEEAVCLWTAERDDGRNPCFNISADWGCVAILENPKYPMREDVRNAWIERVEGRPGYGQLNTARNEGATVDDQGFLQILWPEPVEGPEIDLDLLLATANDPTLIDEEYPNAKQIAEAWTTERGKKEVNYFGNNRKNGIETFEDLEIKEQLDKLGVQVFD